MFYIKLTDSEGKTRANSKNKCQWGDNVTHTAEHDQDRLLCSSSWIHFYTGETLEEAIAIALLRDPADGMYTNHDKPFKAWLCEIDGVVQHDPLKSGAKTVTTIREVEVPKITTEQRVEVAIRISLLVYDEESYVEWANKWLSGEDRSRGSADAAAGAAAATYAANAAAWAANAAAWAANAAAWAAHAAANATAYAADADAANAAADAAAAAANAAAEPNKIKQVAAKVFYRREGA